jgi:hypothetical protein
VKAVLVSNDPVELSWAETVLKEVDVPAVVFDAHASLVEGSIGAVPRRLMVEDADFVRAGAALATARAALGQSLPDEP